jgi:hypothetical protein
MRKILGIVGIGAVGWAVRKVVSRRTGTIDLTQPDMDQPQKTVQAMESEAAVPGGIRP